MQLKKAILHIVETFSKAEVTPDEKRFLKENRSRFLAAEDFASLEKILSVVGPSVHFTDAISANTPVITLLYPMLYDMTKVHLAEPVAEVLEREDENEANNENDLEGEGTCPWSPGMKRNVGLMILGQGHVEGLDHEVLNDDGLVLVDGVRGLAEDQEPVATEVEEVRDHDAVEQLHK